MKDGMNNCTASTGILKNGDSIEKVKLKDVNDISNLEEKFPQDKQNEISNGKLISDYATNDIAKQSMTFLNREMNHATWQNAKYTKKISINVILYNYM